MICHRCSTNTDNYCFKHGKTPVMLAYKGECIVCTNKRSSNGSYASDTKALPERSSEK